MPKCLRCGRKRLFLSLNRDGHCKKCADKLQSIYLDKINAAVHSTPITPEKNSPVQSRPIVRDPEDQTILIYDLTTTDIDSVLNIIRSNPGILQRDLGKNFLPEYRPAIRQLLYYMEKQNLVSRIKERGTYILSLCGNPNADDFEMPPAPLFITPEEKYNRNLQWQKEQLAKYRKAGIRKVEWSCGRLNGRECSECLAKNGKVYWIDTPPKCPAHIGCTCLLSPIIELEGENVPVTGE